MGQILGQAMDKKTILTLKLWLSLDIKLGPFQILLSIKTMHVWRSIDFFKPNAKSNL